MSQYGNAILHDGECILNKAGTAYKVKAGTALERLNEHEQAYREMGEEQAEGREARRSRAVNRPRGQAGTGKDAE